MSKSTEHVLLAPGENGWEIWTGLNKSELTLHTATTHDRAADLVAIPQGELVFMFPIRAITTLPMRVTSDDPALFADLATLHAERLGIRPDPMAGQLSDLLIISTESEKSAVLSIQLRAPSDGDLPLRSPKFFDISPRAYPLQGDGIALWKEFGRWVFSVSFQGRLVYSQATSDTARNPSPALARELRLALIQLSMQNVPSSPTHITVWTRDADCDTSALSHVFQLPVENAIRPAPVIPESPSKLLPADVRAARKATLRRKQTLIGIAALVMAYLAIIGTFSYGLWKDSRKTSELVKQAKDAAPVGDAYLLHIAKWDELANAIDIKNSPVDILNRISTCIPNNSGLRLKSAEISANELTLIGEAPLLQAANTFNLNLEKNNDLSQFKWQAPEPTQSTRGWEFRYIGQIPVEQ